MKLRFLAAIVVSMAALTAPLRAEEQPLFRIFLQDGSTLVSFGEYARQSDRVVFSMPIGPATSAPQLHVVTIAESAVNWQRTEEYAEAVRARRYAETRGEDDFARLSNQVAAALNDVALTKDPAIRLATAEEARRKLAEWPRHNYGYRATDVRQLLWLFDDVVSDLRAAAGQSRYDLTFYANTLPATPPPLMAAPDHRQSMEQALAAARLTPDAGERMSLLRAITVALSPSAADWQAAVRATALSELAIEERTAKTYADLAKRILAAADTRTRRADVAGVQRLVRDVLATDDRLGRRRPQETSALLQTLDGRLDQARRLRLARDAYTLRASVLQPYRLAVAGAIDRVARCRAWLVAIRELAGPSPRALVYLEQRMAGAKRVIASVEPPREAEGAHATLATAVSMAGRAAAIRRRALSSGDMTVAWEASSAAAGALLMFENAVNEINNATTFPQFR